VDFIEGSKEGLGVGEFNLMTVEDCEVRGSHLIQPLLEHMRPGGEVVPLASGWAVLSVLESLVAFS
jgi:hypothetical protein